MIKKINPYRPTDDRARALARNLITTARFGALAVRDPGNGNPMVTRIAVVPGPDLAPVTLLSDLSGHSAALAVYPVCSLLLGEPGAKGDPLTHPRITLQCVAEAADKQALKTHYLRHYPKAQLYYNFGDFRMMRFQVTTAFLNGGFGTAYRLTPDDLIQQG